MNDETLPEYKSVMMQLETGLKFLNETFNKKPRFGWQIDPFGNSAVTPSVWSKIGYEGIILNRVGTTLAYELEKSEALEFMWKGVQVGPNNEDNAILAHVLAGCRYQPPAEIAFQPSVPFWINLKHPCKSGEIDSHYDECIRFYFDEVIKPSLVGHKHNKILSVFGEDFAFYNADYSFRYIDNFIKLVE